MTRPEHLTQLLPAMTRWRRAIHAQPELGFQEHRTAALVAGELRTAGFAVTEGVGRTGVVGTLRRGAGQRAIALRADLDALAMPDHSGAPWASTVAGVSHACGHDGHTAMLLGAALHLSRAGGFDGTVQVIFQPAEESLGGARAMIADGLFDRFPADAVFGLHNMPGLPVGAIAVQDGAALASSDTWECTFTGIGTHGAKPHLGADPVLAAAQFVTALQTIVARQRDPLRPGVVSVGAIAGGDARAPNVIPGSVALAGTARAFEEETREMQAEAIQTIAYGVAAALGVRADPRYIRRNPPTVNDRAQAGVAVAAAARVGPVIRDFPPSTAGEDFAEMLKLRPGAYVWLGTGPAEEGARHHNPRFDFNDDALPFGAAYWCSLVETALPA